MKRTLLSMLMIAVMGLAFAGNDNGKEVNPNAKPETAIQISGKIVDFSTGEALTGVQVNIEGINLSTYTDFDGKFSFSDLKPGEYDIVASFISYKKSFVEHLKAEHNSEIEIKMQEN